MILKESIVKSLMKLRSMAQGFLRFWDAETSDPWFQQNAQRNRFAAPTGTPIMASGSGTVTRARWCGGGGIV